MITFRDRMARLRTQTGWLDSRHTFSFGGHNDPQWMGFRSLRVLNEDRIVPGAGFPAHSHRDMEIVTYVLDGALQHKDSLGTGSIIRPGEVQRMSAGTGITHSEYNASAESPAHFLQIWIIPERRGLAPSYQQTALNGSSGLLLAGGPEGTGAAVTIHQDARMYVARLAAGESLSHPLVPGRGAWVQVARGVVALHHTEMREGDGSALEDEPAVDIEAETDAEIVLFDLG
jgi:hypothetical protein